MKLNLFQFTPTTEVEGPGLRACIQVQGCPIRCPDCGVPQTWQKRGGTIVDSNYLVKQILEGRPLVEGVTFLGGEPFAQATVLADIARKLKHNGLSVVTFTGYTLEFLQNEKRPDYDALLSVTDLPEIVNVVVASTVKITLLFLSGYQYLWHHLLLLYLG